MRLPLMVGGLVVENFEGGGGGWKRFEAAQIAPQRDYVIMGMAFIQHKAGQTDGTW